MTVAIVLSLVGIALLVIAMWRIRVPFARMNELDRLADNAKRYDSWRGGSSRTAAGHGERTGADEMRDVIRRQVYLWGGVGVVGLLLVVGGLFVR
ncbi:MAG: hypothetical protein QFC55_05995 [Chloroflexota bacterium]|nr:hypothetical protein [Chloroflexota bacterium]